MIVPLEPPMTTFQQYQTSVVGVIGFAGVILTLIVNAWIARSNLRVGQADQLRTLKVALTEELKVIKTGYEEGERSFQNVPANMSCAVPTDRMNRLFLTHLKEIGSLSPEVLEKVLGAYLSHDQARTQLTLLATPESRNDTFLTIPANRCQTGADMYHNMIAPIDAAILALHS